MKLLIILSLSVFAALSNSVNGSIIPVQKFENDPNIDLDLGSAISEFLTVYKSVMACGVKALHLAPAAPFTLKKVPIKFRNEHISINALIDNLFITGLDNFQVLKLNYDQNTGKLTYDFIYFDVHILGEYEMEAWAMVSGLNMTVPGKGPLDWEFKNVRHFGEVTIKPNDSGKGSILSDFHMNYVVGDVISNSWNYKWDVAFNNYVNRFLRDFVPMLVQQNQDKINDFYNNSLIEANEGLKNVSIAQMVTMIEAATLVMLDVSCNSMVN